MLHIYKGNGTSDKEKFIFNRIDPHRKTILIVPDQFSLSAERDALRLMNRKSLTDLMIVDFSALGHKIVRELDNKEPEIIDKYGRHMLLAVLIDEMSDELATFGTQKGNNTFADHMNTMISELKRYEIGPEQLEEVLTTLRHQSEAGKAGLSYLTLKLEDILKIYRAYEDSIEGIYRDSEDYITYYAEKIPDSEIVRDADVWIYGFDTFTPKNLLVIEQLMRTADNVSVVMTCGDEGDSTAVDIPRTMTINGGEDLFELTEMVMSRIEDIADELGIDHDRVQIEEQRPTIWDGSAEEIGNRITLVQTSDHHAEAEKAAAFVQHLVRDEGYRYRDIAVICNNVDEFGEMVSRAMKRIGIPVFADRRRRVLHQPVVSFLLSFLDVIRSGYSANGLMGMIKSGLMDIDPDSESLMENYVRQFRIRAGRWQDPFKYKGNSFTDEDLEKLNRIRESLIETCNRARDSIGRRNTAEEKVQGLYGFLKDDFQIETRIEEIVKKQEAEGLLEGAAQTAQIWNRVCEIFDQIIRVIGNRKISNKTLADMINTGLSQIDIGLVPTTSDALIMGTLQRTRPSQIKALVIVGAEEGLLPLHEPDDGLLTRREMEVLEDMDLELARRAGIKAREEQIAIYRMCSLPSEVLYASCSKSGADGSVARPCSMFTALTKYQPEVEGDLGRDDMMETVVGPAMTVSYLAESIRAAGRGEKTDPRWSAVSDWYAKEDPSALARIRSARTDADMKKAIDGSLADTLYAGDREAINVSVSRLEKFNGCPFAHFIQYGLRAHEQALFEVGGREIGQIYHDCIMTYCQEIVAEEGRPGSPGFGGMTRQECGKRIGDILDRQTRDFQEGLFASDEDSRFRKERIREICGDIAWAITEQIRKGTVRSMMFEESFGMGGRLPATEIEVEGRKFSLMGRIDRLDMMGEGSGAAPIRIIDYKTGKVKLDVEKIKEGHQLQLAIYMDAAERSGENKPAGIFYFGINEYMEDLDKGEEPDPEKIEAKMQRQYRLKGIAIDDPQALMSMDQDLGKGEKYESTVIPVKFNPERGGYIKDTDGILMTPDEFSKLIDECRKQAKDICGRLISGEIRPMPYDTGDKDMDNKKITACTYCDFGSICMHEGE